MQLGLHFRLTDEKAARVLEAAGDDAALRQILTELEENEAEFSRACETDKAWDPIACSIAPAGDTGSWPARGVIGGARALQDDDEESWITHLNPAEASEVADYLDDLSDEEFSAAYRAMPAELRNPEYGEDEEAYALTWLDELRAFYAAARAERRHVVFTVWH